ncbi:MAG: crossover junction endodeoxyribonuclease RuvC [Holosporales bacterium]|jgi:crossover junction endodeoxyribonuclease RuvC|nr:crossover junction endodeoxyribonuclease RuvC [Holosporales bacterium]
MSSLFKIICGVDPGLVKTGWGVIKANKAQLEYIDCGIIKTDSNDSTEHRLSLIFKSIGDLLIKFEPNIFAMEEVFVNKNPKTSEKLIMARTSALLQAAINNIPVMSFRPNEIKKNITGLGMASKETVHKFVQKILNIQIAMSKTRTFDSTDALAIAICCAFETQTMLPKSFAV